MIRVLIAEDSPLVADLIKAILSQDSDIDVVGVARNGEEAVQMTQKLRPNLITMDIHMPVMDGFEATKQIMAYCPTPILVISPSLYREGSDKVFKALSYGALDAMEKILLEGDAINEEARLELVMKVKFLSRIGVIHHPLAKIEKKIRAGIPRSTLVPGSEKRVIGIVASTGGPQALMTILKGLPKGFLNPILIVQHIARGFENGLVEWLAHETALKIRIPLHGDDIKAGTIYVGPPSLHLVTRGGRIQLNEEPSSENIRPSGTLLLRSIAESYGNRSLGIVLTGMGRDGADGLMALHEAGALTIVQDEESSVVFGMPKAAIDLGAVGEVLSLDQIAPRVMKWASE